MDTERAKATIRKLLNLAADEGAAQGEVENAMRFAARLMEQHQLSDEDLSEVDAVLFDLEKAEMRRDWAFTGGAKKSSWEGQAAMFVCKLVGGVQCHWDHAEVVRVNGIVQLESDGRQQRRPRIAFYGIAEDVELARQVFGELVVTIASLARLKWGGVYRGDGLRYCDGFTEALFRQLQEDSVKQLAAAQISGGTALVAVESRGAIVKKKSQLAKDWLRKDQGVKLSSGRRGGGHSGSYEAYQSGYSDGQRHQASAERRRRLK